MEQIVVALGTVATLACVMWGLRARRRRGEESQAVGAASVSDRSSPLGRPPGTVLGELRDMREALNPAQHTRIERRRTPSGGPPPAQERRRDRRR